MCWKCSLNRVNKVTIKSNKKTEEEEKIKLNSIQFNKTKFEQYTKVIPQQRQK